MKNEPRSDSTTESTTGRAQQVTNFMQAMDLAAPGDLVDIVEVTRDPTTERIAVTVAVARTSRSDAQLQVGLLTQDRTFRLLHLPYDSTRGPAWSSDGSALAVIGTRADGSSEVVELRSSDEFRSPAMTWAVTGLVEKLEWNTDSSTLAALVASPGAEISDVYGSGTVGETAAGWEPRVSPGRAGRRELMVAGGDGALQAVSGINVWEFAWSGSDRFVAVASDGADEGSWYSARVVEIALTGQVRLLLRPDQQVSCPRANPTGEMWSIIEGVASDRGMVAGSIKTGGRTGAPSTIGSAGVHVTDHRWVDNSAISFIGVRGLDTAVGVTSVTNDDSRVTWVGPHAAGRYIPTIAGDSASGPLVVLEKHLVPPHLVVLEGGVPRTLLMSTAASTEAMDGVGHVEKLTWAGAEDWLIEGFLTTPSGDGPHPLVVNVHGGPVGAWRNNWCGRDPHTTSLVAAGYAVMRPNPRGSLGRGATFAEAVVGDMGGHDVIDITTGIEALRSRPAVDVSRTGITGNSYGGFMSVWLPAMSDACHAAVARSPVTDWSSQHFTTNIAAFDRMFLSGDPLDITSQYRSRSPLQHHERIKVPTLLTAGANDLATPASQAQILYTALRDAGVPASLVIYPEEGHGVRDRVALVDQCTRMVEWFDGHLNGQPQH